MSPLLKHYLEQYLLWVENGAVDQQPFFREVGLCGNIEVFCRVIKENDSAFDLLTTINDLGIELTRRFKKDGLYSVYPFGRDAFYHEVSNKSHHLNEDRLAWVRSKVDGNS